MHALEHTFVRLWASKARFLIADHVSGLAAAVPADGIGLGPDALQHAFLGYSIADLPGPVGRVQAEEVGPFVNPAQHRPHSGDVGGVPVGDRVVKDGPCGDVYNAVQLDPAALEPDLIVPDAEPPDEPVAGVAGAVACQRAGRYDIADDPRVDPAQVWLGNHAVCAPDGALEGYPCQPHPAGSIRVHPEAAHHLPVGLHLCLHHDADGCIGLGRICRHAAQARSDSIRLIEIIDDSQNRVED